MTKKPPFTILLMGNLIGAVVLWLGYDVITKFLSDIENKVEVIEISSRAGFYILGLPLILIHIMIIIEYYYPNVIKRHLNAFNLSGIVGLIIFLSSAIFISGWMRTYTENASYVYCRNASGVSALAKNLVYTKNMEVCEELVASKRR